MGMESKGLKILSFFLIIMWNFIIISPPLRPGERRIRVHTLCLPVTTQLSQVYSRLNVLAIAGTLANMGKSPSERKLYKLERDCMPVRFYSRSVVTIL